MRIADTSHILLILLNVVPLLFTAAARHSAYLKFFLILLLLLLFLWKQINRASQRVYQGVTLLLFLMLILQDSVLGARELASLSHFQNENIIVQVLSNLAQIAFAPIVFAFLLPVWIKFINL
jgi:hypothetical protein